jgi:signal transduction histidine kinase
VRAAVFHGEFQVRIAVLAISLTAVALSLLLMLSSPPDPMLGQQWHTISVALLCVLPLLTVSAFFSKKSTLLVPLLIARGAVLWVVGARYGGWLLLKLPLWSSLLVEAGGFLDPPQSIVVLSCYLLLVLLSQVSTLVWGTQSVTESDFLRLSATSLYLVGLGLLMLLLRRFSNAIREQGAQITRLDEAVRKLTLSNLGLQKLATSAQERSAEEERKRITREIHDAIGYALTNLIMITEAAIRLSPREALELRDLLGKAREEAQVGLNETRKALRLLRNVPSEHLQGLSAVHRLVTLFSIATGVEVKAQYSNAQQSFGEEVDLVVYRMIQEGMTNAFRHGHASLIRLQFWQDLEQVMISLWDNGGGGEEILNEGIGLRGMRERLARVGGTLTAGRVVDGFEVRAWIPLGQRFQIGVDQGVVEDRNGQDIVGSS